MKLKASLLDEIAAINDNEELMEKAIKYLRRLRNSTAKASVYEITDTPVPQTIEELKQSLKESEMDEKLGRTYSCVEAHPMSHVFPLIQTNSLPMFSKP